MVGGGAAGLFLAFYFGYSNWPMMTKIDFREMLELACRPCREEEDRRGLRAGGEKKYNF